MITEIGRKIIELRLQKLSLREIQRRLKCSKSTISKWCSTLKSNPDIIEENNSHYGMSDEKRKSRETEFLRQVKPDDPSWFNDYKARRKEASKRFIMEPANCRCQICGYNKYFGALAFHHINELNKDFTLSGTKLTYSIKRIVEEASKCVLVCHNCHSEIHAGLINDKEMQQLDFSNIKIPDSVISWYADLLNPTKPQ